MFCGGDIQSFSVKYISYRLSCPLSGWGISFLFLIFWCFFVMKNVLDFDKCNFFCIYWDLFIMIYYWILINWLLDRKPTLHSRTISTCWWCINLFMYCWIRFAACVGDLEDHPAVWWFARRTHRPGEAVILVVMVYYSNRIYRSGSGLFFVGRFLFAKFLSLMWMYSSYLFFLEWVLVIHVFKGIFVFHPNCQIHWYHIFHDNPLLFFYVCRIWSRDVFIATLPLPFPFFFSLC